VSGEIIVRFARNVSWARRQAKMAARSATIANRFMEVDLDHVKLPPGKDVQAALDELKGDPEVDFAQPNYVYHAVAGAPNDPFWLNNTLWGLQKISAQQAWAAVGGGNGSVIIADIDTGVDYTHPDLAANMWKNPGEIAGNGLDDDGNGYVDDVFGIDTINHDSNPIDDNGHGTHTSGTIAGVGNNATGVVGVNWNAKILACKFLNSGGSGTDVGAIECLNYIVALKQRGQNIRVTSNSWGTDRGGQISTAMKSAFDAAGAVNILNICAAGNAGTNNDAQPFDPASFTSPSIVSVAASDQGDARASWSNYGATSVDLAAPGVSIYSTIPGGYDYMSGTSMAAPHVAGAAALLASLDPTLTADNLKVLLMQNVDVQPQWAGVVASGGRLNVYKAVSALVPPAPPPPTGASFLGANTTTQGAWNTAYGRDGYVIVNDATSLPSYATVTPVGQSNYTWLSSTTDPRALLRSTGTGRIAATWYSASSFDIDINISDGQSHDVALYAFDFDTNARSQRMDVLDASTGAVLDTRTISSFNAGQYLRWNLYGHVVIRVTRLAGFNAVVSGVFFAGAPVPANLPPTVSMTSPTGGATFTPGSTIAMAANATDDGSVASVAFYADGGLLGTDPTNPYGFNWTNAAVGSHSLTAVATDNTGQSTTSAAVAITVATPGSNTAAFVGADTTTQGTWNTGYGHDGYVIVGDTTSLPAYATVTPAGQLNYTWLSSTTDPRALLRSTGSGRIAATWYSASSFDIDINITDGQTHEVALYSFDFDTNARSQRMDVLDAGTGAVLDTRTISGFNGGQYLRWALHGHVVIRTTRLAGFNAVVSGVFFGGPPVPSNQPPTVSITGPAANTTFISGSPIPITANASDSDGTVSSVAFYGDGQLLGTDTTSPYTLTWANAATGVHSLTAVATDNNQQTTTSGAVAISVVPPGSASVSFVKTDSTAQGNWSGVYGTSGYSIAGDVTNLPSYATVTPSGHSTYVWSSLTNEVRALMRANGSGRLAATWYSATQFDINVGLNDGLTHQVAIYCLDWDYAPRSQRIDVLDAVSGTVLDSRTISSFGTGQYVVWSVRGNVKIRLTRLGGFNAVVSGVFIN
jgi:subtilisin family serine protease